MRTHSLEVAALREASKSLRRRWIEDAAGVYPWKSIFLQGKGIDIGCGPDILPVGDVTPFDQEDGDANHLSTYVGRKRFDWAHSSQSLEHMRDPTDAILDWVKVVRPGGKIIVTVPSWELYEGMIWPSRYNPDHKSSWSMWQKGSPAPHHIHVPSWASALPGVTVDFIRLADRGFDYTKQSIFDQTFYESDGVEAFIEFVLTKNPKP